MPFMWDDDRRAYQRAWVAAKRKRRREQAKMTIGERIRRGRELAALVGQAPRPKAPKPREP